jgi:hypothetical protein
MPDHEGDDKNWWEKVVEDRVAAELDRRRAAIPPHDVVGQLKHDIQVGAVKGVYNFGKGIVTGLYALGEAAVKLVTEEEFRGKVAEGAGQLAKDANTLLNGSPEQQAEVAERARKFGQQMYDGIKGQVQKDWEQAGKEGKRAELASKWATQGALEFASLFVGVGEVKGALNAAKAADVAKAERVAAKVVAECPKEKAARAAKAAKPVPLLNPPIKITPKGMKHVTDRHTYNGIGKYADKSKFNNGVNIEELIQRAAQQPMVQQRNGNFVRVIDTGQNIGLDRATNTWTSTLTVVTKPDGTLVTAFPGRP